MPLFDLGWDKMITKELNKTARKYQIMQKALKEISKRLDCGGLTCYYCEQEYKHPPTPEAVIAKKALAEMEKIDGKV